MLPDIFNINLYSLARKCKLKNNLPMQKCAFLSIANTEGWFIDDDLVHQPLIDLGWIVENVPWNQPTDWNRFDIVIIRSTWDYQNHLKAFKKVLKEIEQSDTYLLNDLELVNWNINKNYLFELERKGVDIVPTLKVESPQEANLREAFDHFKTDEIIVKPIIGANADDTFRVHRTSKIGTGILSSFDHRTCMIQPFMKNIIEQGEYSLMYFQGKLSHTILKTVKTGDYRVQEEHGGGVIPITLPESLLVQAADKALHALPQKPFYARVDMVRTKQNSFVLMELELIEPCLYFRFDENAAQNFAQCIQEFWQERA